MLAEGGQQTEGMRSSYTMKLSGPNVPKDGSRLILLELPESLAAWRARVEASGFRLQSLGFRFSGSGLRV